MFPLGSREGQVCLNIISINFFFRFLIEFFGVTLVNQIIQVSGVQFYNISSIHCIVCSSPQVKPPSILI